MLTTIRTWAMAAETAVADALAASFSAAEFALAMLVTEPGRGGIWTQRRPCSVQLLRSLDTVYVKAGFACLRPEPERHDSPWRWQRLGRVEAVQSVQVCSLSGTSGTDLFRRGFRKCCTAL